MTLGIKCAYTTCGKYSIQVPDEAFFPFPTDLETRAKWIHNSGLLLENSENHDLFLCQDHFNPDCFINASLIKDAIPYPIPWIKRHKRKKMTTSQILSDYFMQMCKSCGDLYSKNGPECDCNAFKNVSCTGCNLVLSPSKLLKHKCSQALLKKNCIVSRCNSNSKVPTIPLPEDVNLRNAWLEKIPISIKYHTKLKFVVCLKHFKEEDIIRTMTNVTIKEKAIPEIFNVPLVQDRGVEKCCLPYCRSNHFQFVSLNSAPITTFQFPVDSQAQRREWVNAIFKRYICHINEGSICIKHFKKNQVFQSGQLCYLSHGAVPSKFFKNGLKPDKFVSCCVPGCLTIVEQGVDFFPFPRHGTTFVEIVNSTPRTEVRDIHELWLERIGISDVTDLTVICKNHFSENSILLSENKTPYLRKSAVPTLNLLKPFDPCLVLVKPVVNMKKDLRLADVETLHSGGEEEDLNRPCSKPHCFSHLDNNLPQRTIHKLPKDLFRAKRWADICGCPYWLDDGLKQARKNIRICNKHFRSSQLLPNNRLRLGASPYADEKKGKYKLECTSTKELVNILPKPGSINILSRHKTQFKKKPNILKSLKPMLKTSKNDVQLKSTSNNITTQINSGLANNTINLTESNTINNKVVNNQPGSDIIQNIIPKYTSIQVVNPELVHSKLILPRVQLSFLPVNTLKTQPPSNSYIKCAVDGCDNYFDETRAEFLGQSYFVFPENTTERLLWLTAINKPFTWDASQSRICFRHFHETDVVDGKLLPNAVPTLNIKSKCLAYRPYALNAEFSRDDEQPLPKDNDNLLIIDNPFYTPPVNKNASDSTPQTTNDINIEDTQNYDEDIDSTDETYEPKNKKLKKKVTKETEEVKVPKKRGRPKLLNKTVKKKAAPKQIDNSVPKRKVGRPKKINNISANTKPRKKKSDEIIASQEDSDTNMSIPKKEYIDYYDQETGFSTHVIVKQDPDYDFEVKEEVLEDPISDLHDEISIKEEPVDIMDVSNDSSLHESRIDEVSKNKTSLITNKSPDVNDIQCEESEIIDTFMTYINSEVKKNLQKLPSDKRMPFIVSMIEKMNELMKKEL